MKVSRRSLLKGALIIALVCAAEGADAWTHGFPAGGQTVINVPFGQQINLFKNAGSLCSSGCGTTAWPGYLNSDGYIASADPPVDIAGNFNIPFSNYYGHYTFSYAGCGSFSVESYAIVYSGGATVSSLQPTGGASSGSTAFNLQFSNQCNLNSTPVEFSYGGLFNSIANNGSGKVRLGFTYLVTGNLPATGSATGTIQINNVNGITAGTYTYVNVNDGSHIDIPGLSYNSGTMSIVSGSPGTASEGIIAPSQGDFAFNHGLTSSWTMSNALLCRTADYANCVAGKQWNPDFVTQIQQLKPGFLRFMDVGFTNGNFHSSFTSRAKNSNFTFEQNGWVPCYWVGTINNSGGDAYTSSNPSCSPGSGALTDGEIVQGQIDIANSGNTPTIALSGRSGGAKPIFSNFYPQFVIVGGASFTVGDVINFTVTASYLSGGAYTLHYTLTSSDTNAGALSGHLASAINADATLSAANILETSQGVPNGAFNIAYNRSGQGVTPTAATSFSYTRTGTGGETLSFGTMPTPTQDNFVGSGLQTSFAANELVTLVYSKILDAFVVAPAGGGMNLGASVESMTELCNETSTGCWINIPIMYSGTSVTSLVQNVAANLNSSLNFGVEVSNEMWNFADQQTNLAVAMGASLGFTAGKVDQYNGFTGLRFKQFMDLAQSGWTGAGRSRSSMVSIMADWLIGLGQTPPNSSSVNRLNGTQLVTSNPTYNALGGLGGTSGTTYTATGSRPIDDADMVSVAPYWQGPLIAEFATDWSGSASTYAAILQAGSDYASGNPTLMASALSAIDTDSRNGFSSYPASYYANIQTIISGYDSYRSGISGSPIGRYDYEGGSQQGLGSGFPGTQDTGNDSTGYAPLSAQFTSLGWSLSAYASNNACGLVSTNDIVACNVVKAYLAWKNSSLFQATVTAYLQQIVTAHPGRTVKGAWYGYTGPSLWEFYPGSIYGTPQTSFNAFQAWP